MSPSISCIGVLHWEYLTSSNCLFSFFINQTLHSFSGGGGSPAASSWQLSALKSEATHILSATDLEFQKAHIPLNESQVTGKLPVFFMSEVSFATEITQSGKESLQEVVTRYYTTWYSSHVWPSQAGAFSCFIKGNQFGIFINQVYATYLELYFI